MKIFEISLRVKTELENAKQIPAERRPKPEIRIMKFMVISDTAEAAMENILEAYDFGDVEVVSYSVEESDDSIIFLSSTPEDEG
jgi:hypothetical protein